MKLHCYDSAGIQAGILGEGRLPRVKPKWRWVPPTIPPR